MKRITRDGDEFDAYSRRRRQWYTWKAGVRKRIKRRTHKRERHEGRLLAHSTAEWS